MIGIDVFEVGPMNIGLLAGYSSQELTAEGRWTNNSERDAEGAFAGVYGDMEFNGAQISWQGIFGRTEQDETSFYDGYAERTASHDSL